MPSKNVAAPLVLGVLLVSLIAIYLVTSQSPVVTALGVILLAVCLVIAVDGEQRELTAVGVVAGLISVIAVWLVVQAEFGRPAGIFAAVVWVLLLASLMNWYQRNAYVREDRAIMVSSYLSQRPATLRSTNARPIIPVLEHIEAEIPLYDLDENVKVTNVNTRAGHNINAITVQVRYRVFEPEKVLKGVPNRGQALNEIARTLGKTADAAATDVVFWEKLLARQINLDVDDVVRKVVYNYPYVEAVGSQAKDAATAADAYLRRNELTAAVLERMRELSSQWGVQIVNLELEHFDVDSASFKAAPAAPAPAAAAPAAASVAVPVAVPAAVPAAAAPVPAGDSDAELEEQVKRVRTLVQVLRESGVPLTEEIIEDIVVNVIQQSQDRKTHGGQTRVAGEVAGARPATGR